MDPKSLMIGVVIALSVVGVAGDVFLKKASAAENAFLSIPFMCGFILYSGTAFGWVIAMKHLKMATVGSVYSVSTILLLAVSGALLFDEDLSAGEIVGIGLAIASLIVLSRHS